MKILLTRTKEQNEKSAERLKARGYDPICLALSDVVDTGIKLEKLSDTGVIITSSNAVKILHQRQTRIDAPIYVVGKRTKQAIENYKLGKVLHVAPNAKILADYLSAEFSEDVRLTYLAGGEIAFDFNAYAPSKSDSNKILVDVHVVYKIVRLVPNESVLRDSVVGCANGVQLHYSAASAEYFFKLIRQFNLDQECKSMNAVTISNKTSHSVDFSLVKSVQNAKIETEGSMFELIQNTPQT